jgi:hypothetical protein
MSSDIRIKTSFFGHPKVKRLAKRLGSDAVVALLRLWCWVADNKPRGVLDGMDSEAIELASDWCGGDGFLFATLVELRLIDVVDGVASIHDWCEHNPWVYRSPERSEAARNAINARWDKEKQSKKAEEKSYGSNTERIRNVYESNTERNTERNTDLYGPNDSVIPLSSPILTSPILTSPDLTLPNQNNARVRTLDAAKRELAEAFTWWWSVYPGKGSRKLAEKAWIKNVKDMATARLIIDATNRQRAERESLEAQGGHVPFWRHGATWLNQAGWEDEPYPLVVKFKGSQNQRASANRAALDAFLATDE